MWNKCNRSMMFTQMMFGLGFYGVMVTLTRFFLEELQYNEADTIMIVGAFASVGPLFAIAGGFIADKFLGSYRSLSIAYFAFAAGYGCLVFGASITSVPISLMGIALASYARGLMSPNYPSLYKTTFDSQESFEKGYPINYSINNVGALLGQYLFPMFVLYIGFSGGFLISTIMATLAVITIVVMHKPLVAGASEKDQTPVKGKDWLYFGVISIAMIGMVFYMFDNMDVGQYFVYAIGGGAIAYFISLILKAEKAVALKLGTILIMTLLTTAFFVYYGQMMTSMTLVSINTMRGDLFGILPIAPEASMAMNPLWCIAGGPLLAMAFAGLEKRNIFLTTATKVSFAFVLTAIAFAILTGAVMGIGEDVIIRPEVFLLIHFFQAFAEVIVGSMVVAFILSVTPKAIENFSVSLFSVAIALSGIVGAVFSTSIAMEKGQKISQEFVQTVYGDYFLLLTQLAVVMVIVALVASKVIKVMLAKSREIEAINLTTAK